MYIDLGNGRLVYRPVNLKYTRYASRAERRALTTAHNSKRKTLRSHREAANA
jgi:hypothetical protein